MSLLIICWCGYYITQYIVFQEKFLKIFRLSAQRIKRRYAENNFKKCESLYNTAICFSAGSILQGN